jgi:CoA binding domain
MVVPAGEAEATMLRPLLEARYVAIVGASTRPGSFGKALMRQVLAGGFAGSVQPVNPRYREVEGLRCVRPWLTSRIRRSWHCWRWVLIASRLNCRRRQMLVPGLRSCTPACPAPTWTPGCRQSPLPQGWPCAVQTAWGSSTSNVRCGRAPMRSRAICGQDRSRSSATPVLPSPPCCTATVECGTTSWSLPARVQR